MIDGLEGEDSTLAVSRVTPPETQPLEGGMLQSKDDETMQT